MFFTILSRLKARFSPPKSLDTIRRDEIIEVQGFLPPFFLVLDL